MQTSLFFIFFVSLECGCYVMLKESKTKTNKKGKPKHKKTNEHKKKKKSKEQNKKRTRKQNKKTNKQTKKTKQKQKRNTHARRCEGAVRDCDCVPLKRDVDYSIVCGAEVVLSWSSALPFTARFHGQPLETGQMLDLVRIAGRE